MKRAIYLILVLVSFNGYSQFFPLEAGLSGGISSGITFRAYLSEQVSYETLLSFRNSGVQMHLFRQTHHELQMTEGGTFSLVYGYGVHAGFYYSDTYTVFFRDINYGQKLFSPVAGFDGMLGVEFRMEEAPLTFGLNYKPFMELSWRQIYRVNLWDFGFTVKYRFKPENTYF